MVQAAAEGVIDYSKAIPSHKWWWRKLELVLSALERKNSLSYAASRLQAYGVFASMFPGEEARQKIVDITSELSQTVREALYPWVKPETKSEVVKEARQAWIDMYGVDPDSEEGKQFVAQALAALKGDQPTPGTGTDAVSTATL